MSSRGTGSPITKEDARDLLHKLITESTKVQAAFASGCGVVATVKGVVKIAPTGSLAIMAADAVVSDPTLMFDPEQATSCTYGDVRSFGNKGETVPGGPVFSSALVFILRDGSQFSLFEIARDR